MSKIIELLEENAALLRFYEASHRAKGPGHEEKVLLNAAMAQRIEDMVQSLKTNRLKVSEPSGNRAHRLVDVPGYGYVDFWAVEAIEQFYGI